MNNCICKIDGKTVTKDEFDIAVADIAEEIAAEDGIEVRYAMEDISASLDCFPGYYERDGHRYEIEWED